MGAIVFLGAKRSGSVREAITSAHDRLGLYTVVLTDRRSFIRDVESFPDIDKMIYIDKWDFDGLAKIIRSLKKTDGLDIQGVVSFVDPLVSVATALAQRFCDNHLTLAAIQTMEDKIATRTALKGTSFNPVFKVCRPWTSTRRIMENMIGHLPVVIKVPDSTGSKNIRRALNPGQFERRLERFRCRFPNDKLLVEEYIKGAQYLVEAVVEQGDVTVVAIIQQHMLNRNGYMVVDGYAVLVDPPEEFVEDISSAVTAIVRTLGMETGTCHLELRRAANGEWKLIEINPRISGTAMNRMIQAAYGINYVEETLKLILGEKPDLTPTCKSHVYTKFLTSDVTGVLQRVRGMRQARQVPGVQEVFVGCKKGQRIRRTRAMGDRYAYAIAADEYSFESAKQAACRAIDQIRLVLEGK